MLRRSGCWTRGHELNIVSGGQYGRGQMILRDGDS